MCRCTDFCTPYFLLLMYRRERFLGGDIHEGKVYYHCWI